MSEPSILARTAAGAGWLIGWRIVSRLLGVINTLVLLRLLTPADFGLVTMAFTFTQSAEALTAVGTDVQLIRSRDPQPVLYDTAFTFNMLRALLLAGLIAVGSGPVAAWFNEPRLRAVLLAVALHILFKGCGNVRTVDFQRALRFGKVVLLQIVPRLVQVIASIGLALALRTYWALILSIMAASLAGLVLGYAMLPVRPRLTLAAWRELFAVSLWTWLGNVATVLRDRTEMVFIGRVHGVIKAGLFGVAFELATLPLSEVFGQIGQAAMPGFSAGMRLHGDGHASVAFRRVLALGILLSVAMGIGLSLVTGPFVALAIGPRWAEAAPLMAIIAAMFVPMGPGLVAGALLAARGRFRLLLAITAVAAVLRAGLVLAVTGRLGLPAIATGMGAVTLLEAGLLIAAACRSSGLSAAGLAAVAWRPLTAAAAMVLALYLAGLAWMPLPGSAGEAAVLLFSAVGLGAAVFSGTSALLWLAAGRPASAERDVLLLLQRNLAGLASLLRR